MTKMTKVTYRTIIVKDGRGYHGYVPALPGCHTYGLTVEKTRENLKDAIRGWIEASHDLSWDIPEDTLIETLETVSIPPSVIPPITYA